MIDNLSNGTKKVSLACSVTKNDDWEQVITQAFRSSRIYPSYENIAHMHSHQVVSANESLGCFRKDGYGQHMSYMELVDFENDLFKYCIEVRKEVLFKRELVASTEVEGGISMDENHER